tara:strand:+ start:616 stop:1158 length:543 start_codon:yes stop_codon:yes gene_type:complete
MAYNNINNLDPLILATEVISISMVSQVFDTALLTSSIIKIAEISHLEKPLSREFYEELVTQHDSGGVLTVANQLLMDDYLTRCLAWFVKLEAMNEIQNNVTSSGVMTNIDDYSVKVTPAEFNMMKIDVERKAGLFLQDMLDFLTDATNINNYPTFRDNTHDTDIINDGSAANKKGGIIFY